MKRLTDAQFENVISNMTIEIDVFLEKFGFVYDSKEIEFWAFYDVNDLLNNQHLIDINKVDFNAYLIKEDEQVELTETQKSVFFKKLKELYENEFLEAKEEYENPRITPLFGSPNYRREMEIMTSDWYSLQL